MDLRLRQLATIALFSVALARGCCSAAQQTQGSAESGTTTLHVDVDVLLLPVVVRDAQGRAVGNLRKEDFTVSDEGKPREISRFTLEKSQEDRTKRAEAASPVSTPNSASGATTQPQVTPSRFVVLLFDDRHLSATDLEPTKQAATRLVDQSLNESDWAAVVTMSGIGSGMTQDHARLQSAIMNLKAQPRMRQDKNQCPYIDYYSADQILNKNNGGALDIAIGETVNCSHATPVMAESMALGAARVALEDGDDDARASLEFVRNTIRTMAALPGQRTLILVSPGFASYTDAAAKLEAQILDYAASSNVTINALDARGLYSTNLGASYSGPSSLAVAKQQANAASLRANQFVMAELAGGSGGTFFHNDNDLGGGFSRLITAPEYVYVLEISLRGVKPNGSYHSLKVKVNQSGLKLEARSGYLAPPAPNGKKPNNGQEMSALQKSAMERLVLPAKVAPAQLTSVQAPPDRQGTSQLASVAPAVVPSAVVPAQPVPTHTPPDRQTTSPQLQAPAPASTRAIAYPDLPLATLKAVVPALNGLKYDPRQDRLPFILANMAAMIAEVMHKLPNLISREDIYHPQGTLDFGHGLAKGEPWNQQFKYLILCHRERDGSATIEESRIDRKGRAVNAAHEIMAPHGFGFAYQWLLFSAANQPEFRFRYLGEQEKEGRKTFVVAFAQNPGKVKAPAHFQLEDKVVPFFYQGILWIDQSTSDIVLLRTDLLAPIPSMQLTRLATDLHFESTPIHGFDAVFWLPHTVEITTEESMGVAEEVHQYSDYHLYHATARIVPSP